MRKAFVSIGALALISAVSACGGKKESSADTGQEMNIIMEATSPFGEAEIRMNDAMMKAVGVDAGDSWVRKMIEHHRGAIEISRQVLTMKPDSHIAQMARAAIDKQTEEIADLQKLVAQGRPDHTSADLYQPAMDKMHQAMMAATGVNLSETYHRKMLEHHKGAVAMSDVALANGVTGAIRAHVEKTRADQLKGAEMVEAMLEGKPMQQPRQEASGSSRAETSAATASKGMPAPGTRTPEHVAHDTNEMGNMDMNRMNHM